MFFFSYEKAENEAKVYCSENDITFTQFSPDSIDEWGMPTKSGYECYDGIYIRKYEVK